MHTSEALDDISELRTIIGFSLCAPHSLGYEFRRRTILSAFLDLIS